MSKLEVCKQVRPKAKTVKTKSWEAFSEDLISATASNVIRRSELSSCLREPLFPQYLLRSLTPKRTTNPFVSYTASLPDIMNDFFDCARLCAYSWPTFARITSFAIVYQASAQSANPKEFHAAVDHEAPSALLIFFKTELIIGVTYCKPLADIEVVGRDLACGYFSLMKGQLNSFIAIDHTLVYIEEGFQLGQEPVLRLDLNDLHNSTSEIEVGQQDRRTVSEAIPQWQDLISHIAVVKLLRL